MNRLLVASIDRFGPIRPSSRRALEDCSQTVLVTPSGEPLVRKGQRSRLTILTSGIALHRVPFSDNERQIVGIAVPGDILDLDGLFAGMDHELSALSECVSRHATVRECQSLVAAHADLMEALCRAVHAQARRQRNWLVSLGRRSAMARAAYLFAEVYHRLSSLDLAREGRCGFPALQSDIADALGLSVVHTHRVLRGLRNAGLASLRDGVLTITDWIGLTQVANFKVAAKHADEGDGQRDVKESYGHAGARVSQIFPVSRPESGSATVKQQAIG